MTTAILALVSNALSATGAFFTFQGQKLAINNSPALQANARASRISQLRDLMEQHADDYEAVRKADAEV